METHDEWDAALRRKDKKHKETLEEYARKSHKVHDKPMETHASWDRKLKRKNRELEGEKV